MPVTAWPAALSPSNCFVIWTKDDLLRQVQAELGDHKLILVSNREPYVHRREGDRLLVQQPASGMAAAIDPILKACGGTWIAHGSGPADREAVDERGHVAVPPEDPKYTLRRIWLTPQQEQDYYYGCSNESLWPLCHMVYTRPVFEDHYWDAYREVNQIFADAVLEEAGDGPAFVFVQDYHFALLPRMVKERNPRLTVAQFWHIPWPTQEMFRTFPWGEEMLEGLLGNDLLGFHLRYHSRNFTEAVRLGIEARADQTGFDMTRREHVTRVRAFPISIDYQQSAALGASPEAAAEEERWRKEYRLEGKLVGIGIERSDYTKGIPERLRAVDRMLEQWPEYRGQLVFVQIAVPSRAQLHHYQKLDDEITRLTEEINGRWGQGDYTPVILLKEQHGAASMAGLHRVANFCVVSALHDGMNLVAKEFCASRADEDGVLILSRFTGAARELTDALQVNPFAISELAQAGHQALQMPVEERTHRMRKMRHQIEHNNIYRWASELLSALTTVE